MSIKHSMKSSIVERPRYYPRQLITADDLTLEQDYVREKLRRHNRMLHGWGVVCGAKLELPTSKDPWKVLVKTGYILGPFGDEIWIERDICLDLRTRCYPADTSEDPCNPCAEDPIQQPSEGGTIHVAIRYRELKSRPVRTQPVGCGCDDSPCEYSRWRDGYELCILDDCPESHPREAPRVDDSVSGQIPDCPPMPTDPWVVLAEVAYDAQGTITSINHCACRRQVAAFGSFWWKCAEQEQGEKKQPDIAPQQNG